MFNKIIVKKALAAAVSLAVSCVVLSSCGEASSSNSASSGTKSSQTQDKAVVNNASEHVTSPAEMRDISSMDLVKEMSLAWNLGNSLDVCNADRDGDGAADETADLVDETLWGNVETTKEIFETLQSEGFNAVRIPITWRDHIDENYTIDTDWMNRVEEVVDYAYDLGMYVVINVHHDGGGDPDFGAWIRESAVNDYDGWYKEYSTIWTQIAERFENYSDKLIFESMNEVGFDELQSDEAYALLNKMNQAFVDLIRGQGGNNPERHLLIAGYWTDIEKTCDEEFEMPTDSENRCILSVHYYTPWDFCTCNEKYEWGTAAEVDEMTNKVNMLVHTFIDNGVPVIVGEYGTCKGNDEKSRVYFSEMFTYLTHNAGMPAFYWDDGGNFDRTKLEWTNPDLLTAIERAVSGEEYTVEKAQ